MKDPKGGPDPSGPNDYQEAVIAFSADFHLMPAKSKEYFSGPAFTTKFAAVKNPVFSRNLAVRR